MGVLNLGDGHWQVGNYEVKYCIEPIGFANEEGNWDFFFNELDDKDEQKL